MAAKTLFAVIDIETTGGSPKNDRITEIAIYIHDGLRIVDEYVSLVNPECTIPYFITGLTGITNEMVADAPKFYEIARDVVQITEGKIFVGHNVNFDYSFVRQEFKQLGYAYSRKTLDTVKYARQVIPGLRSYSLGRLCKQLNIPLHDRHRAAGDALATVRLLEELLSRDHRKIASKILKPGHPEAINPNITRKLLDRLPEEAGVYYLWDEQGELLYIGKSINIRSRILQHLHNNGTQRAMEMRDRVADITWDLTGNELAALLLESHMIKTRKPPFNRKQRRHVFSLGLYTHTDAQGYQRLEVDAIREDELPLTTFTSRREAREIMHRWVEEFGLCQKLCGLYESAGACFQHGIGDCTGACCGEEAPELYNDRIGRLLNRFEYDHHTFFIVLPGRVTDEICAVHVEQGKFIGLGYAPADHQRNPDLLRDCIRVYPDNREVHALIKLYLSKNEALIMAVN